MSISARYMRFPSAKLEDVRDTRRVPSLAERHAPGKHCPAQPPLTPGTVVARVFGRALDRDGKPVADTVSQEHYIEDRFNVPVEVQETLARALADGGTRRVRIPDAFARLCVTHAYLGQLDVRPLSNPCGGACELRQCEFTAQWERGENCDASRVDPAHGPVVWRVHGKSEVFTDEMANAGPGDSHEVTLAWEGLIEMNGSRLTRVLLVARGKEKLRFGSARGQGVSQVASLPAGRRIDMACAVRYGIIGEPVAQDEPLYSK